MTATAPEPAAWGFTDEEMRGVGSSVMFADPPGTGKTMAAGMAGHDQRPSLLRSDLSKIVSKYIGETEKNLRRVFAAAKSIRPVLLFDEADALFGKRTAVKDSHDRYSNDGGKRRVTLGIGSRSYRQLTDETLARIPAHTPEWTNRGDADPGVTLLDLFALLGGTLAYWGAVRWLLDRTGMLGRTVTVTVDGAQWHQVDTLGDAGPDDQVYSLDPSTGTVEFGDGAHGKQPTGTVTTKAGYRYGAGAVGAVAAAGVVWVTGTWLIRKRWTAQLSPCPACSRWLTDCPVC